MQEQMICLCDSFPVSSVKKFHVSCIIAEVLTGFLHPVRETLTVNHRQCLLTDLQIIHLGFGLEFNQPAIIAEALAETCVHDNVR